MLVSFLILVFKVLTMSLIIEQRHLYQHKPYAKFMFPLFPGYSHLTIFTIKTMVKFYDHLE